MRSFYLTFALYRGLEAPLYGKKALVHDFCVIYKNIAKRIRFRSSAFENI